MGLSRPTRSGKRTGPFEDISFARLVASIPRKSSSPKRISIEFEDFEDDQEVYKLPCGHIFSHSIFTWLKEESNKCPICRYELSHKEIKNEDYLIDISSNITDRQHIPVNPFGSFLNNMRNVSRFTAYRET